MEIGVGEKVVHGSLRELHGEMGLNTPPVVTTKKQEHDQESGAVPANL
jgi:hypothetical protein